MLNDHCLWRSLKEIKAAARNGLSDRSLPRSSRFCHRQAAIDADLESNWAVVAEAQPGAKVAERGGTIQCDGGSVRQA